MSLLEDKEAQYSFCLLDTVKASQGLTSNPESLASPTRGSLQSGISRKLRPLGSEDHGVAVKVVGWPVSLPEGITSTLAASPSCPAEDQRNGAPPPPWDSYQQPGIGGLPFRKCKDGAYCCQGNKPSEQNASLSTPVKDASQTSGDLRGAWASAFRLS